MTTPTSSPAIIDAAAIAQEFGCDRIMSFQVWCLLANVSASTAKRLIASGRGPKLTRMSERCMGVRVSHHVQWLAQLEQQDDLKNEMRPVTNRARSNFGRARPATEPIGRDTRSEAGLEPLLANVDGKLDPSRLA